MALTDAQYVAYSLKCPYCEVIQSDWPDLGTANNGDDILKRRLCSVCGAIWWDVFTLVGYTNDAMSPHKRAEGEEG